MDIFASCDHPTVHQYLRAIEDLRGFVVKHDGLAVDVTGQAARHDHQEDEDEVGGHRGRVFTAGARPTAPSSHCCCA